MEVKKIIDMGLDTRKRKSAPAKWRGGGTSSGKKASIPPRMVSGGGIKTDGFEHTYGKYSKRQSF
jgi:hypothetical protein